MLESLSRILRIRGPTPKAFFPQTKFRRRATRWEGFSDSDPIHVTAIVCKSRYGYL